MSGSPLSVCLDATDCWKRSRGDRSSALRLGVCAAGEIGRGPEAGLEEAGSEDADGSVTVMLSQILGCIKTPWDRSIYR